MTHKLQSRKFLLALFAQITGLVVLFFPEHSDGIEAAATQVGAMLLMALTAFGWMRAEAEVDRERVAGETTDRQTDKHLAQQREMHSLATPQRQAPLGLVPLAGPLLGAALLLGAVGGCATSPQDRWHQAHDALTTARNAILAQHTAGNISDAELVRLDEFEKAARTALEAAEPLATDPDADGADLIWHLDLAERVLERLIDYLGNPDPVGTPESEARHERRGASEVDDSGPGSAGRRARAAGDGAPAGRAAAPGWQDGRRAA